ncbi:MAG: hypothetical protein OEN20_00780 [Gammaproteobacteria bacterium]|nr:hypothetical protein [Gammaproteobacteria bacterium]
MALVIATTVRNACVVAAADLFDTASPTPGTIVIFQGTQPANPQTAHGSTALATLTFSDPAFGAPATGTVTAGAIASDTNVLGGTAQWARVYDGGGVDPGDAVMDMDIGQGSGTLSFDNTTFVGGGTAAITSFTMTMPES